MACNEQQSNWRSEKVSICGEDICRAVLLRQDEFTGARDGGLGWLWFEWSRHASRLIRYLLRKENSRGFRPLQH